MPSPLGHALGGVIAGWLVGGVPRVSDGARRVQLRTIVRSPEARRSALAFGLLGILADFDFLVGSHSTYSHSVGAALIVCGLALAWFSSPGRGDRAGAVRASLAVGAAYASHILLDWLGTDGAPPFGIMALWPFSSEFYLAGMDLFPPVERRFWLPDFWLRTLRMLVVEILVLGSVLMTVVWWGRARNRTRGRESVVPSRG